jgi:hypothetical protein
MEAVLEASKLPQGVSVNAAVDVRATARLDLEGKTVNQVFSMLSSFLCKNELEPEWLSPANLMDDPDEASSGARHSRVWPSYGNRDRISVSVCIGSSEGWIVHVDWISRLRGPFSPTVRIRSCRCFTQRYFRTIKRGKPHA